MENVKTFKAIHLMVKRQANFTPSALMRRWANEHNKQCRTGEYFEQYIVIDGRQLVYDHYEICYYNGIDDIVTLYLTEKC